MTYADSERWLLHRPGLEARFRQKTRPRIDAPQRKTQERPVRKRTETVENSEPEIATDYWARLNQKLTVVMGGSPVYWQREPNPHQLILFCRTIDELRSQVEAEGLSAD